MSTEKSRAADLKVRPTTEEGRVSGVAVVGRTFRSAQRMTVVGRPSGPPRLMEESSIRFGPLTRARFGFLARLTDQQHGIPRLAVGRDDPRHPMRAVRLAPDLRRATSRLDGFSHVSKLYG